MQNIICSRKTVLLSAMIYTIMLKPLAVAQQYVVKSLQLSLYKMKTNGKRRTKI